MPDGLVVWEAQFGDFVNAAQVIIDQFIASGEDKWNRLSGITMLLPHGFEGQGPEHSSARIERFLQLSARDNWRVAVPSTPAQYFHLLRRQARHPLRKPLIVFTPKSLLRTRASFSPVGDLAGGGFAPVVDDPEPRESVRRVVVCSGKLFYDLARARAEDGKDHVALVRLEELYPFPDDALDAVIRRHGDADVVWAQEEPVNMGAAVYCADRFAAIGRHPEVVARAESPSPATGSAAVHQEEQESVVRRALGP
jgi:2-oxoglutarate dehydrogenase E1 component